MKDVIMHHPDWTVQQGNRTLQAFEDRANEALDNPNIYIEVIPEEIPSSELTKQHWDLIDWAWEKP